MAGYAEATKVPVEKSRAEIEGVLRRYGATGFISGWNETQAVIGFQMGGRQCKFFLPIPNPAEDRFTRRTDVRTRKTYALPPERAHKEWEQACRQRWRALALVIRAKLEAVAAGITVFEDEFMAHIVLPDGQTIGQVMRPQIEDAYREGRMPPLLPNYSGNA